MPSSTDSPAAVVTRTNNEFYEVAESATRIGTLVSEIAAASQEQSQGVNEISAAVTDLDRVIQGNAACADNFAEAAERIRVASEEFRELVILLSPLVGARLLEGSDPSDTKASSSTPKGAIPYKTGRDIVPYRKAGRR